MKKGLLISWLLLLAVAGWTFLAAGQSGNNTEAMEQQKQSFVRAVAAYAKINTYTLEILLQERHKGKIKGVEHIRGAFRKNPFKLYSQWLDDGIYGGMLVSYVADRDGPDHFLARGPGAAGLLGVDRTAFDDYSVRVLYPHHLKPNQYHLGYLLESMQAVHQLAMQKNKMQVILEGTSTSILPGRQVKIYRNEFSSDPNDGISYLRSRVGFDQQTQLPLFIETYDFSDRVYASYKFIVFNANAPVNEELFDL